MNQQMLERMRTGQGFIAALDQSGGSTPKALKLYGIEENEYSGEAAMFDLMHAMRSRMIKSSVFNSNRILAVILFEMTMLRQIDGIGTAEFLWQKKGIVPFLKTDNGLASEADGVQLMKPIPELADRVAVGVKHQVFGTKMRSVIKEPNAKGIEAIVAQQFELGQVVLKGGMVPIIEPEVDIKSANKSECENLLKKNILAQLDALGADQKVMLKLTIPTVANFFEDLIKHPKVIRVVALSGGYARDEANALLAKNRGMIASFSRALAEGLSAKQSDSEFDSVFDKSIGSIFDASTKKVG
jgi:fructose-bisphosphate aldolase class I